LDKIKKIAVAPSLLSANFMNLQKEISSLGNSDMLHLDVMDMNFVPNLTFGFPIIKQIRKISKIPLDVHLMVSKPDVYIQALAKIGVDYISVHQEATNHLHGIVAKIKENGIKAGVAINPGTSVELLNPILSEVDFVLLMSVNPGFGGQSFLPLVYEKLEYLKPFKKKYDFKIQIDGGVNDKNSQKLVALGADILVAGSFIFDGNYREKISLLKY